MSRLAKKNIMIPEGVTVERKDGEILFKGTKGEQNLKMLSGVSVTIEHPEIKVEATDGSKQSRSNVGTLWSLIKNQIEGVSSGFVKILDIEGVGFRATMDGNTLVLNLGFVHPRKFVAPEGVTVITEKNSITISGADKAAVGQAAAKIRDFKKPEPYKGKGIRYRGEVIRRKVGKKAGTSD